MVSIKFYGVQGGFTKTALLGAIRKLQGNALYVSPAGSVGASKCHRHFDVATGDPHPLAVVSKGGGAALAGGIQWRVAPSVAGRIQ